MAVNEGQVAQAVRRDSPWRRDPAWQEKDPDLRQLAGSNIDYDPDPLHDIKAGRLHLLYGPSIGAGGDVNRDEPR